MEHESARRSGEDAEMGMYAELHKAVQTIASQLDLDEAQSAIVQSAADLLRAEWSALLLLDEETNSLNLAAHHGTGPMQEAQGMPVDDGLVGRVAESRQPLIADDGCDPAIGLPIPTSSRVAMAAPLQLGDRFLGVLAVADGVSRRRFDRNDLGLLATFAVQAAAAIENARWYERERQLRHDKEEFVSIISHEFKTPLTSIKGFAQLVARRLGDSADEGTLRALETINVQTNRLARLATDLTLCSRLESGRVEMQKRPFDLLQIVVSGVELLRAAIDKHDLVVDAEEDSLLIVCDPERVRQAFVNLLSNAVRFSPEDGGEIRVAVRRTAAMVTVAVLDQGLGLTPEQQEQLFTRCSRLDKAMFSGEEAGLELAIARAIVVAHGGRIWAESTAGEGSTLYFTLPIS